MQCAFPQRSKQANKIHTKATLNRIVSDSYDSSTEVSTTPLQSPLKLSEFCFCSQINV